MLTFNKLLKVLRESAGVSVNQISNKYGIHRNTITNYESERDQPFSYLLKFSYEVNASFSELIKKKIAYSDESDEIKQHALSSMNPGDTPIEQTDGTIFEVEEDSHAPLLVGNKVCVVPYNDMTFHENHIFGFTNPMTKKFYGARILQHENSVTVKFGSKSRDDVTFMVDGDTELKITLKVMGFEGRISKAYIDL